MAGYLKRNGEGGGEIKKEMATIPMLFWVLSSQSFMRISRAGQDDGDVGAPIMQTVRSYI